MLSTCSHRGFGNEDCVHSEDVAVICNTISSTGECNFRSSYDCCAAQNKHHQAHYFNITTHYAVINIDYCIDRDIFAGKIFRL